MRLDAGFQAQLQASPAYQQVHCKQLSLLATPTLTKLGLLIAGFVCTVVLKASSRATDGNIIPAISAEYERVFSSAKKIIL